MDQQRLTQQMYEMQQSQPETQLAQSNQGAGQVQASDTPIPLTSDTTISSTSDNPIPSTSAEPQSQSICSDNQPQDQATQLAKNNQSARPVQIAHPSLTAAQSQTQVVSSFASTQSQSQSQSQEQFAELSQSDQHTHQVPAAHTSVSSSPSQSQFQEQTSRLTQSDQGTSQTETLNSSVPPTQTEPPDPLTQSQNQSESESQSQSPQQSKVNMVSLCTIGQKSVQEIVHRTRDLFQVLAGLPLPDGTARGEKMANDKKTRIDNHRQAIKMLFRRLRLLYEKCNENCQGMEYIHIESLIPLKEEWDMKAEEKTMSEEYGLACVEHRKIMAKIVFKNRHLRELIDQLRRLICDINTMLNIK